MRRAACAGDDDFDAAFFGVGSIFEKQIGRAVGGDYARFMWNTESLERLGDELHGIPIRAGAHDDAHEGVRDCSLSMARRALPFCLHSICQPFKARLPWQRRSVRRPYKTQVSEQRLPARKPALQRPYRTGGDILRFFSARGDLRALLPIVTELSDQIEGAGNENGVFGGRFCERVFKRALGVGYHEETRGMMAGIFRELFGGNGARGAGRCEDDFLGAGEEEAGYFVNSFIAKGG